MAVLRLGIFFRGLLMGIAEIIPGISGGTVALITGIYSELVTSLASFGATSVRLVFSPRDFFAHHNMNFLVTLFLGMLCGALMFSQLFKFLFVHYAPIVWGFLFGLVLGSVFVIGLKRKFGNLLKFGGAGLLLGFSLTYFPTASTEVNHVALFFVGMLAVCAWILPGISGSFVLLAFGYYQTILEAVSDFDWNILLVLIFGLISGLLAFSKLLRWLILRHEDRLLSLLTGFMMGSLARLWPWQAKMTGQSFELLSPQVFSHLTGETAFVTSTILASFFGLFSLWLIGRIESH